MSNLPTVTSVHDIQLMADAIAKSNLFGIKKPEEAMALMLIAQAEGSHPAIAMRDYQLIQGKPALKADAMLARFQSAGGKVEWLELTDKRVAAKFSHPSGGSVSIDWDIKRADAAGLASKEMWKKYPRQMLRARVISEGIRTVFPGVLVGSYTPEEIQDMDQKPETKFKGVTIDNPPPVPTASNDIETVITTLSYASSLAELNKLKAEWLAPLWSGLNAEERRRAQKAYDDTAAQWVVAA